MHGYVCLHSHDYSKILRISQNHNHFYKVFVEVLGFFRRVIKVWIGIYQFWQVLCISSLTYKTVVSLAHCIRMTGIEDTNQSLEYDLNRSIQIASYQTVLQTYPAGQKMIKTDWIWLISSAMVCFQLKQGHSSGKSNHSHLFFAIIYHHTSSWLKTPSANTFPGVASHSRGQLLACLPKTAHFTRSGRDCPF